MPQTIPETQKRFVSNMILARPTITKDEFMDEFVQKFRGKTGKTGVHSRAASMWEHRKRYLPNKTQPTTKPEKSENLPDVAEIMVKCLTSIQLNNEILTSVTRLLDEANAISRSRLAIAEKQFKLAESTTQKRE
jgi:hypothetical protein